ncbi:hypothetical protein B7H27_04975, partial [Stenotrophomonas maltophilia]
MEKEGVRSVFLRKTDLTPRAPLFCRAEPMLGWRFRGEQPSVGSALQEAPSEAALLLLFFFLFRGWKQPETVRGRAGWVRGGVSRMDAAAKPTRTY